MTANAKLLADEIERRMKDNSSLEDFGVFLAGNAAAIIAGLRERGEATQKDAAPQAGGTYQPGHKSASEGSPVGVALVKREDVVYLITHQRTALLETAEKVAPHHAGVLRDMAGWWQELGDAVKKLKDHSRSTSARSSKEE